MLSRRAFLRATALGVLSTGAGAALAGCSRSSRNANSMSSPDATPRVSGAENKVLLAYFSRAGENYYYGGRRILKVGNTAVLAVMIADRVGCDVFRIEAAEPYSDNYDDTVARNVREERQNARPGIVGEIPSLDDYGTVLLGSPVWNVQTPMIMRTFADAYDWTGKIIHPFVTFAVSGLGNVVSNYQQSASGAHVSDSVAIQGEQVSDAESAVEAWLSKLCIANK
jgi:flavodoxin